MNTSPNTERNSDLTNDVLKGFSSAAMTPDEFYNAVLPATGPYCTAHFVKGRPNPLHKAYDTRADLIEGITQLDARSDTIGVFHVCASIVEKDAGRGWPSRTAANMAKYRCFRVDFDIGAGDDMYSTVEEIDTVFLKFCADVGLVEPILVRSGSGRHAYIPLSEDIDAATWKPVAEAFKKLMTKHGLKQDESVTADLARVLRAVGSTHRKDSKNPRQVCVVRRGGGAMTLDEFKAAIDYDKLVAPVSGSVETREQVSGELLNDVPVHLLGVTSGSAEILAAHKVEYAKRSILVIAEKCQQVATSVRTHGDVSLGVMRGICGLAKFDDATERATLETFMDDAFSKRLETGHGQNDWRREEREWKTNAPPTCSYFDRHNPDGCMGCAFADRVKTPMALGVIQAPTTLADMANSLNASDDSTDGTDWLTATNQDWFVVRQGGKTLAWTEEFDVAMGRYRLTPTGERDFKSWFANIKVPVGDRHVKLGDAWWTHPLRRQYKGVIFAPGDRAPAGYYNTWRGFAIEPIAGCCELILRHVHEVICDGNAEHARYVLNWAARMVQRPDLQGEVAIVVQGEKGAGKSQFGRLLMGLMGRHAMQIASSEHLCGKFTGHLRDTVFLFADEAFYAGDKRAEAVLKMVITEPVLMVESKYADAQQVRNYLHIYMATNNAWAVPMSADERRFMVLTAANRYRGDAAYFNALNREIDNGGREAFLQFLLDRDISTFNVRAIPRTDAAARQKLLSNGPVHQWLEERLHAGALLKSDQGWIETRPCQQVTDEIAEFYEKHGGGRRGDAPTAQEVRRLLGEVLPIRKCQRRADSRRVWCWSFPCLDEARRLFCLHYDSPSLFDEDEAGDQDALKLVTHG